ncbi:unnamed protein product [Trichogramma brassicae]|uniref:Reverse transcriptase RNase H-like domain-containing protein n=1 Tax=Trichogramma brassicae TaxID=86971 RepID=A0A6H5ISW9_9HYME|nr:unnamed protein product [Trichogramma brassicae]
MKFPTPTTPTQIRGFLGLVNFNSRFTARLEEAATLLIELTSKEKACQWSEREKQAFENVKNLFCTELFLHHPRQDQGYVLFTDASQNALGSALCQEIEPGDMRIIYMANRTLKGAEFNYYTTKLELLAIVWALEKFRSYVYGREIEIRTDHQALTFVRTSRFLSQRLLRWSLMIQDYNLTIKHIPGKANLLADIMSRPLDMPSEQTHEASIYALLSRHPKASILKDLKQLRSLQAEDAHLKRLQASEKGRVAIDSTGLITWNNQHGTRCYLPFSTRPNFDDGQANFDGLLSTSHNDQQPSSLAGLQHHLRATTACQASFTSHNDVAISGSTVHHYLHTEGHPVAEKARRLPADKLKIAKAYFADMQAKGLVKPSDNRCHPFTWSRKRTGRNAWLRKETHSNDQVTEGNEKSRKVTSRKRKLNILKMDRDISRNDPRPESKKKIERQFLHSSHAWLIDFENISRSLYRCLRSSNDQNFFLIQPIIHSHTRSNLEISPAMVSAHLFRSIYLEINDLNLLAIHGSHGLVIHLAATKHLD